MSVLLLFDTANAESNNGITSTLKVKGQNESYLTKIILRMQIAYNSLQDV